MAVSATSQMLQLSPVPWFSMKGQPRLEHMVGVDLAVGQPEIELSAAYGLSQFIVLVITNGNSLFIPIKSGSVILSHCACWVSPD